MKEHEKIFFALCAHLCRNNLAKSSHYLNPRDIVNILCETIPHKRCWYYLKKWSELGFYDYGVTLDLGWFYLNRLPQRYLDIMEG